MPDTEWREARRDIARPFGLVEFKTTGTDYITTDDKIASTELLDRFNIADQFKGWWAVIVDQTDGDDPENGIGTTIRRVEAYAIATGELTCAGANFVSEGTDHVLVDLYRQFHPDDIKRAYNRARQQVYPRLVAYKDHRGIVTDVDTLVYPVPQAIRRIDRVSTGRPIVASHTQNLLTDGGFENWDDATTLTNWTLTGAASTVNRESIQGGPQNRMVLTGNFSARLHGPSANTILSETVTPDVAIQGVNMVMSAYVYCRTDKAVKILIGSDVDSSDLGSFHGGTGWELLTHSFTIGDTAANVILGIYIDSGTTAAEAYVDRAVAFAGPGSPPEGAWSEVQGWEWVPPLDDASDGGKVFLPARPVNGQVLRLNGRGLLSSVSVDTDEIELDGDLLEPLYMKCRELLCQDKAAQDGDSDWGRRAQDFRAEFEAFFQGEAYHGSTPILVPSRRGPF